MALVGLGSMAPARPLAKPPVAEHVVLSSAGVLDASNAERSTALVLADPLRQLHFVTGRSGCRVRSTRKAGHGRQLAIGPLPERSRPTG